MDPKFDKKLYFTILYQYYHIDHIFCIVLDLHRGKPPLSTERYS